MKTAIVFGVGVALGALLVTAMNFGPEPQGATNPAPKGDCQPDAEAQPERTPPAAVASNKPCLAPQECPDCGNVGAIPERGRLWPSDIPTGFDPKTVRAAFDNAKEVCPKLLPANARLDCVQFPCAMRLVFESSFDEAPQPSDIEKCSALKSLGELDGGSRGAGELTLVNMSQSPPSAALQHFADTRPTRPDDWRIVTDDELAAHCESGSATSCSRLAGSISREASPYAMAYAKRGCELGSGSACVTVAHETQNDTAKLEWLKLGCRSESVSGCIEAAQMACRLGDAECRNVGLEFVRRGAEMAKEQWKGEFLGARAYRKAQRVLAAVHCRLNDIQAATRAFANTCRSFESCRLDCGVLEEALTGPMASR